MALSGPAPASREEDARTVDALTRRIARLEKENKRWGVAAGLLLGVIALVVLQVGREHKVEGEIKTNKLTLLDSTGRARAELVLAGDASPQLRFLDRHEKIRAVFGVTDRDIPVLTLAGADEKDRVRATLGTDGTASLTLLDARGRPRSWLGAEREGLSGLTLYGSDGRPMVALTAVGGGAGLSFLEKGKLERVGLGMRGGSGLLRLGGGEAENVVTLAAGGPGAPSLSLVDKANGGRSDLMIMNDGAFALTLRDKKGALARVGTGRWVLGKDQTVIWSAP